MTPPLAALAGLTQREKDELAQRLEAVQRATAWRCWDRADCDGMPHEGRPYKHARAKQRPPWAAGSPAFGKLRWYLRGGRGAGKTWTGSHALAELILTMGGTDDDGRTREYLVCAKNYDQAVSVCIEGQSGLLAALEELAPGSVESWLYSRHTVKLTSGAVVFVTGAHEGAEQAQGRNLTAAWLDEIGLWFTSRALKAWLESILPALRKATRPYVILTGTPKQGHPLVRWFLRDPKTGSVVMPTRDNLGNLSEEGYAELEATLTGRLARQELDGEFLEDVDGALWTLAVLENGRVDAADTADLARVVVAWDPAVSTGEDADEHGIVVAAVSRPTDCPVCGPVDRAHAFVLEDVSGRYDPAEACRVVADAYDRWAANGVVAEGNQGQKFITALLGTLAPNLPVELVHARDGKRLRAEPVAVLAESRFHLVGDFPALETQMTTWTPAQPGSPDRLDAMVHGVTYLLNETGSTRGTRGRAAARRARTGRSA